MAQAPTVRVLSVSQSLALTVTGMPDVHNRHGSGHIRPSQVTLHYRGDRIRAHLYGRWVREDGELTDAPIDQDHAGPLEDWPDWLAALAREHQPAGAQPPADRAAVLREAADELAIAFGDPMAKHIGALGASFLRRRAREVEAGQATEVQSTALRRLADETQPAQPAVAYRSPGTRALYCVTCARQEAGWQPVTEVRDDAVCDFCGGRVLAVASRTLGDVIARYAADQPQQDAG